MPQPLKHVPNHGPVTFGHNMSTPSRERPHLALLAMNVIAEWSVVEARMLSTFIIMLGANARLGTAIYTSLVGEAARRATVRAVAQIALDKQQLEIFEAILSLYSSYAKERHKLAHWVWGSALNLPDGVLLRNPNDGLEIEIETTEYMAASDRYSEQVRQFAEDSRNRRIAANAPLPQPPKRPHRSFDETVAVATKDIFVYTARDFEQTSDRIQRLITHIVDFGFVIMRHPADEEGQLTRRLSNAPEIRAILDRPSRRRKTAQEAPPQWPLLAPPWQP